MTDFIRLISDVIFASQDWHGGDAICLLESPQGHIRRISRQEIAIQVPYCYDCCFPPDEAETLRVLNELLFLFSSHVYRGRCPPGHFASVDWCGNAVCFRICLASGQPGGGSGGAEL